MITKTNLLFPAHPIRHQTPQRRHGRLLARQGRQVRQGEGRGPLQGDVLGPRQGVHIHGK